MNGRDMRPPLLPAGEGRDPRVRMREQNANQFQRRVPGGSKNGDVNHVHYPRRVDVIRFQGIRRKRSGSQAPLGNRFLRSSASTIWEAELPKRVLPSGAWEQDVVVLNGAYLKHCTLDWPALPEPVC